MSEPKPLASLSAGLLARKGQARPAMRPQLHNSSGDLDDLGWNDMGGDVMLAPISEGANERIVLKPMIAEDAHAAPAVSPALEQQAAIASAFTGIAPRVPQKRAKSNGPKTAFTLRLDADRHTKLRFAVARSGRSAQSLIVEAFDRFLTAFEAPVESL